MNKDKFVDEFLKLDDVDLDILDYKRASKLYELFDYFEKKNKAIEINNSILKEETAIWKRFHTSSNESVMRALIDERVKKLFQDNWTGEHTLKSLENMKKQLHKNLTDQMNGYWSGSTAYFIMTNGGFLIDAKSGTKKQLTEFGKLFIETYEKEKVDN